MLIAANAVLQHSKNVPRVISTVRAKITACAAANGSCAYHGCDMLEGARAGVEFPYALAILVTASRRGASMCRISVFVGTLFAQKGDTLLTKMSPAVSMRRLVSVSSKL